MAISAYNEKVYLKTHRAGAALRIHDLFQQNPFPTSNQLVQQTDLSAPTVNAALVELEKMGIVEEITGRETWRVLRTSGFEGVSVIPFSEDFLGMGHRSAGFLRH